MTVLRGYLFSWIRYQNLGFCRKNPKNYLTEREFSKITFLAAINFREFCQKPRNPRKFIPAEINTNKVAGKRADISADITGRLTLDNNAVHTIVPSVSQFFA